VGTPATSFPINTYGIDNAQRYPVIARVDCRRITVQEDYNSANPPTADLLAAQPAGGTQMKVAHGTSVTFTPADLGGYFKAGTKVGDIQTVAGSITVQQQDSQAI
jgi:hypothetical protein